MQKTVAGIDPAERGELTVRPAADRQLNRVQERTDGKDSAAADQAVDLRPEGSEGDQVNQAERSQENLPGEKIAGLVFAGSNQEHIDAIGGIAMGGNESVGGIGYCGETG